MVFNLRKFARQTNTTRCCRLRVALCLCVVSFVLSASAHAAPPTPFGGGTVCPAGFTCGAPVTGPGFFQQSMTDSSTGETFIKTEISNTGFSSESFILQGATGGISTQQTYTSDFSLGTTSGTATINKGWADNAALPESDVLINQNVNASFFGSTVNSDFQHQGNLGANDVVTGIATDIRQELNNTTVPTGAPAVTTGVDAIVFVHRLRGGDFVPSAGSQVLNAGGGGGAGGGGMGGGGGAPAGGTLTWSAGDTIAVTFIGQICDGCVALGGGGMGGGGGGGGPGGGGGGPGGGGGGGGAVTSVTFGFMAYENLSQGTAPIASRSLITASPFDWAPIFGPAPVGL